MQKSLFLTISACALLGANQAGAGQITDLQLYDGTAGSPIVTIEYTGLSGSGAIKEEVYADPQVSYGTSNPLFYSSTITKDYDSLISFAGYNPLKQYGADFWQATHDSSGTLYQDLVSAPAGGGVHTDFFGVPEPSSGVLGLVSMLSLGALRWWRRTG